MRYYRPSRQVDKVDGVWQGQSRQAGGNVTTANGGAIPRNGSGHHGGGQRFPLGHSERVGTQQQFMGPRQPGPVELSNFWNVLASLGEMGLPNQ